MMTLSSKKVAILAPVIPPDNVGGVASAHYNLFRQLRRHGWDARIFTFQDPAGRRSGDPPEVVRTGTSRTYIKVADALVTLFLRFHRARGTSFNLTDIFAYAAGAFKLRRPLHAFAPDVVILPDQGAPGFFLGDCGGARVVVIAHHNPMRFVDDQRLGEFSREDAAWAVAVENRVLKHVDLVICPSRYMEQVFRDTYRYAGPIQVIPNLLDRDTLKTISPHDVRPELGLGAQDPLIYIPSAGNPFKGAGYVCDMLRALSARHDGPLGIFLSGAIDQAMTRHLASLSPRLHLHHPGALPYEKNLAIVKGCSLGISPTLVENYGMALLEACACQVPMVTFDVGGNCEIVINGRNGLIVPCGDVDALVEAAAGLLASPSRLADLRAGCLEVDREIGDEKNLLKCYFEALESLRRGDDGTP